MTDNQLKVSLLQANIAWHQPLVNLKYFDEQISLLKKEKQLIVLPEMWLSGYTMQAHKMYELTTIGVEKMREWALSKNATVVGSLIYKETESYYNRLFVVSEDGVQATYDKRHLFGFAGEDRVYKSGEQQLVYNLDGWRIAMNVCYDLRFPVWARNTNFYDVLLYVANWPDQRISAWNILLRARAIENQAYVLGANCFGTDAWGNSYSGHSSVLSPSGEEHKSLVDEPGWVQGMLSKEELEAFRAKFPFLKDRDDFRIIL